MYEYSIAYPNGLPDERKPFWWSIHNGNTESIPDPAMMKQGRIDSAMYPVKRLFKDFILNA
jgi:hypothetical protein